MNTIYGLTILIFLILLVALILGLIKPSLSKWLYIPFKLKRPISRRFILLTIVPALFVTLFVTDAVMPESIRTEQAIQIKARNDQKKLEQSAKQTELEYKLAEERRISKEVEQKTESEPKQNKSEAKYDQKKSQPAEVTVEKSEKIKSAAKAPNAHSVQPTPSSPAKTPPASKPRKTAPKPAPRPQSYVHPGSYCSSRGSRGVFKSGNPAICAMDSKGVRLRWQSPR